MPKTLRVIALLLGVSVILLFVLFVFNQTVQVVQSARALNPVFGDGVMWALIFTYCILLIMPVVLWFRLPKRGTPPATMAGPEYERFMAGFRKRLARNVRLRGVPLQTDADVNTALLILDKQAHDVVASAASAVFLSTAVLQSGRLDVLVVLAAQTRLIWQVAHVYYQRPSVRDFVQLYANVAATAFIAAGIEDVDVDVLVGTVFGSTMAAIPGMHLLASSILTGSANAFLTLRVGMIAKEYCRCTASVERRGVRRAATLEAARLLGSIVRDGTTRLSRAAVAKSTSKLRESWNWVTNSRGVPKASEG